MNLIETDEGKRLDETSLQPAPPEVLVPRLQKLTKEIHRAASLRDKLDLLALQNEIVGALVIGR